MAVHSLNGPWLTFEEITTKTGKVKNELLYAIQMQQITPVIYLNHRAFLAYSLNDTGQRIGHAQCYYSGPVVLHPDRIKDIVSHDRTIAGFEPVTLCCPTDIRDISIDHGFSEPVPQGLFHDWQPNPNIAQTGIEFMLLPHEYRHIEDGESVLVEHVPEHCCEDTYLETHADRFFIQCPGSDTVYGSYYSHLIDQNALRFPVAAIDALTTPTNTGKTPPAIDAALSEKRHHDLHRVIALLLCHNPTDRSGSLWNKLRKDIQQPKRQYDEDHVITTMNHAEIFWESAAGHAQVFKKRSFENRVSRLRKVGMA